MPDLGLALHELRHLSERLASAEDRARGELAALASEDTPEAALTRSRLDGIIDGIALMRRWCRDAVARCESAPAALLEKL